MAEIIFDKETIFEDWSCNHAGNWFRTVKYSEEWISVILKIYGGPWSVNFNCFDNRFDDIKEAFLKAYPPEKDPEIIKAQLDTFLTKISKLKAFI